MPWKKDLAKLKQDLGKEETPPGKATPPPKAKTLHPVSRSIEEEDNIFLNAMGLRPRSGDQAPAATALAGKAEPAMHPEPVRPGAPLQAAPIQAAPMQAAPMQAAPMQAAPIQAAPAPVSVKAEFTSAMSDLKGLKPLKPAMGQEQPAAPARTAQAAPAEPVPAQTPARTEPAPEPLPSPTAAPIAPGPAAPSQVQIHLAAGMAIVVDGSLDLKGHARSDAEERLKERLLDGYALGWRTLHVLVGPSEELRQMVLDLLKSPAGRCVARYAQAPVPMGGPQGWVLYFRGPGTPEN